MPKEQGKQIKQPKIKLNIWNKTGSFDMFFLVILLILLCIGLVMVFSASYASAYLKENDSYFFIKKQLFWAAIGIAAMLVLSKINYNVYRILAFPSYVVSLVLLFLVLVIGKGNYDEKRWLVIGGINFQPSELAKITVIMLLALYVAMNYNKMKTFYKGILFPGAIFGLAAALIVVEPHLSGAVLVTFVGFVLMIVGGANLKFFAGLTGLAIAAMAYVITSTDYMTSRINIWLNPASDPRGKGFQTLQSLYAIGSGGLFGLGLGRSRQKYLYIPEPQNDFIFSIVCEELGFIGAMLIILLFVVLIYRGYVIAWSAPDKFGSLLVVGIVTQIAIQTLLNIAVVTNSMPVTGISLPFFSYGGTSLTILLAEMGIVLSVSRYSRLAKE